MPTTTTSVLLITLPTLLGRGIEHALEEMSVWPKKCVVSPCVGAQHILQLARNNRFEVTLLDALAFEDGGFAFLDEFGGYRNTLALGRVIVFTTRKMSEELHFHYLQRGVAGFAFASNTAEELIHLIEKIVGGMPQSSEDVQGSVDAPSATLFPQQRFPILLSESETTILQMISQGITQQTILQCLTIRKSTLKNHLTNIFSKLGVNDRSAAVAKALELGYILFPSSAARNENQTLSDAAA